MFLATIVAVASGFGNNKWCAKCATYPHARLKAEDKVEFDTVTYIDVRTDLTDKQAYFFGKLKPGTLILLKRCSFATSKELGLHVVALEIQIISRASGDMPASKPPKPVDASTYHEEEQWQKKAPYKPKQPVSTPAPESSEHGLF
jgi:hypothetical protein